MAIEVHDNTRRMMRDSCPRRWMVQVFYPAAVTANSEEKYLYMPGTIDNGIVEGTQVLTHANFGRIGPPPNSQGKPILFIRGMMQYQPDDIEAQLNKITNAILWLPKVQHSAFSDQAYLAARIPGFGDHGFTYRLFYWFFKRGPHFDDVDTSLGGKDADIWFAEYRKYVVDWLDKNINLPNKND